MYIEREEDVYTVTLHTHTDIKDVHGLGGLFTQQHKSTRCNLETIHREKSPIQVWLLTLWFRTPETAIIHDFKAPQNIGGKQAALSVSVSDHKRTKLPKTHLHIPLCCAPGFIICTPAQSRGIKSSDPTKVKVCPINLLFCAGREFLPTKIWQWRRSCCTITRLKIVNKHHLWRWQRNRSTFWMCTDVRPRLLLVSVYLYFLHLGWAKFCWKYTVCVCKVTSQWIRYKKRGPWFFCFLLLPPSLPLLSSS